MSLQWAIAVVLALAITLVITLGFALSASRAEVAALEITVERVSQDNRTLADSLAVQNAHILDMRQAAEDSAARASVAAGTVLQNLPAKIKQDKVSGTSPKEANQWMESLFLER